MDAGLLLGGVGRADAGVLDEPQGTVMIFELDALGFGTDGSPGNALCAPEPEAVTPDALDAEPQDLACETWERDDCAVEDLSLRTRVDLG